MGFKKRTLTTSKPEIHKLAKKEAKLIIDDIDVDLKLPILKPSHAHWIKGLYDYVTFENGREIISNG